MWLSSSRAYSGVPQPPPSSGALPSFLTVQNAINTPLAASYQSIGQAFPKGSLSPGQPLSLLDSLGNPVAVQIDPIAYHIGGSIRFAALTFQAPALSANAFFPSFGAGTTQSYTFSRVQTGTTTALTQAFVLASLSQLTVTINLSSPSATNPTQTIDLRALLASALSGGTADIFLQGPLAFQARVSTAVAFGLSQYEAYHIDADLSVCADGSVRADIQLCNDNTTLTTSTSVPILSPLVYTASITLNGVTTNYPTGGTITSITQWQYQNWRAVVTSSGVMPWGHWSSPYNIQSDIAYLITTNAIPPYDLTHPPTPLLSGYASTIATTNFGQPFTWMGTTQNGLTNNMGVVGDNPHLGPVSEWGAAWLQTSDYRAQQIALAIGDTAGSVPIHVKVNGQWASVLTTPKIWLDGGNPSRIGGGGEMTSANTQPFSSGSVTQNSGWVGSLLTQHYPSISIVPWLLTANRWFLDNLNAYAAYGMTAVRFTGRFFNVARQTTNTVPLPAGYYGDILMFTGQGSVAPRAVAWCMRDIADAAYTGRAGSVDQINNDQMVKDNFAWAVTQIPGGSNPWLDNCGEATGFWMPQFQASGIYAGAYQDPAAPLPPVLNSLTTSPTGGTLVDPGNLHKFYYQVTAVGANGESIGSNELSVTVPVGSTTNSNTLSWTAVAGVTGYKVFRGTASNAEGQNPGAMYQVGAGVTTFTDTGAAGVIEGTTQPGKTNSALGESLWQWDFESSTIIKCASMGYTDAITLAQFQLNWLANRWIKLAHDSCAYRLMLCKGISIAVYNQISNYQIQPNYQQTFADIETLQQESYSPDPNYTPLTNGSGWANSQGYYGNVYRMVLGWLSTGVYGGRGTSPAVLNTAFDGITNSGAPNVGTNPLDGSNWLHTGCKWNIVQYSGVS